MTAFLPLEAATPFPASPAFLVPSPEPASHVKRVIKAILKARRIAVVCGAGISVQAGIPDFRSSEGLFQSLKKDHPMLSSGKDLFDASVFNSEETVSLFCQMIAQLSQLSEDAEPTAFHRFLRALDERRRLLRVYTQNIDALEEKSGLTFGVPELDSKRAKPRSTKGKTVASDVSLPGEPSTSRLPSPPVETPRCIPLHGTLQAMHCQTCTHSYPLRDYIDNLASGTPPPCPQCTALETTRQLVGKRSRGVGRLRPSVVLYNEDHKDGEEVGNVVRKDLMGSSKGRASADLLLVVGTSLRVPGTKRIVREFSKAVRSRHAAMNSSPDEPTTSIHGLATPTPSPRRSPAEDEEPPIRTVYLNLDFPVPTREWEGVFDVWLRGDAQEFARMVQEELARDEQAKEAAKERRRRREEVAAEMAKLAEEQGGEMGGSGELRGGQMSGGHGLVKKGKKRKEQTVLEKHREDRLPSTKRRKTGALPLSPISPPSSQQKKKIKTAEGSRRRRCEDIPLPTPPVSREDGSKRLVIKLPPRPKLVPEVVITTTPERIRRERDLSFFSSPLSSPPLSACSSPPNISQLASTLEDLSSPLSSPTLRAISPYNMSQISSTLSHLSTPLSSPRSLHISSPPNFLRTVSSATQLSSPLSSPPASPCRRESPPPSPHRQEISPPPSPSPPSTTSRRYSRPAGSLRDKWLVKRPGTGRNSVYNYTYPAHRDDAMHTDSSLLTCSMPVEDEDNTPSGSRLPTSYARGTPLTRPRPVV